MNPFKVGDYIKVAPMGCGSKRYGTVTEVSGEGVRMIGNDGRVICGPFYYFESATRRTPSSNPLNTDGGEIAAAAKESPL